METTAVIGKFIKKQRAKQKMSLADLSKKAFGSPHQAKGISLIERGKTPRVEFKTIDEILVALGFSLKEIFKSN